MVDPQRLDFGGHDPDTFQRILSEHNARARRLRDRHRLVSDLKAAALAIVIGFVAMALLALAVHGARWLIR